jgi:hypothetical protein
MSDKILDVINPDGDLKEQLEMIRRNFLALQKNSLGQAAQVLFEGELTTDVGFGASYADISELSGGFTSSGGLVMVVGSITLGATSLCNVRIVIDDEEKMVAGFATSGGGNTTQPLLYTEKLAEGSHKLQIQGVTSGATAYGATIAKSYVRVIEFLV